MPQFILLFVSVLSVAALTTNDKEAIETQILLPFYDRNAPVDQALGIPGDTPAGIVRLIFHDCATWDPASKTGGCHACLAIQCTTPNACEYTASENNGLQKPINQLETLYINNSLNRFLSRSDFWVLAATYAIKYTSGGNVTLPYYYGRTDCPACPLPRFPGRLPSHQAGQSALNDVFLTRLAFTPEDLVAILGAHCLGSAKLGTSGVEGHWTRPQNLWNNGFYPSLANIPWIRQNVQSPDGSVNLQFVIPGGRTSLMLTTDMALLYTDILNTSCNATLGNDSCPINPTTGPLVQKFAASNSDFNAAFQVAWLKLSGLSYSGLKTPDSAGPVASFLRSAFPGIPLFYPQSYHPCPNSTTTCFVHAYPPTGYLFPQGYPIDIPCSSAAPPVALPAPFRTPQTLTGDYQLPRLRSTQAAPPQALTPF